MITQEKFHKLCKYSVRLQKSFISNNLNNYAKYCSHLKYHIGEQIGSGSNPELDRLFDILTKYINDNSNVYNITNIEKKFVDEKKQLETNIELYKIKIQENEDMVEKLNSQLVEKLEKLEKLEKNNLELDEKTKKLNSQMIETKKELEKVNSNEYTIKKLEELRETKYDEFVDLLKKLFTQAYSEQTANNIIDKIGQAETWKDSEVKKQKRIHTKVNVNEIEYTWDDIINQIKSFKTDGSDQLIKDIKKYLETGDGDVNDLISRYETELNKSTQNLVSNAKQNQSSYISFPSLNVIGQNPNGIYRTEWKK